MRHCLVTELYEVSNQSADCSKIGLGHIAKHTSTCSSPSEYPWTKAIRLPVRYHLESTVPRRVQPQDTDKQWQASLWQVKGQPIQKPIERLT